MCYYELSVCAYPHHDAISSLIFDPQKNEKWVECDLPKPWGRMSCGNLIVHHSLSFNDPVRDLVQILSPCSNATVATTDKSNLQTAVNTKSPELPVMMVRGKLASFDTELPIFPCQWCTTALKVVATKAKYLQKDARDKLDALEDLMDQNPIVRNLYDEIAKKEAELDKLRHKAWVGFANGVQQCSGDNKSRGKENSIIQES